MIIDLFTTVVAVAHVVIAAGASVHVLLSHREVRSAIAWIALVWLSPFIGTSFYLAFGINRVARRATRLRSNASPQWEARAKRYAESGLAQMPEHMKSLARAGDALMRLPIVPGNSATFLTNGDGAYPAMIAAIDEAQHSVALSSYIFDHDQSGGRMVEALIAAHKRGVEVRVLIDGIGAGYFYSSVYNTLRAGGVKVKAFMHSWAPWRMAYINLRNHKKILVVDGRVGFTGGMNISDRHFGGEGKEPRVRDTQVRLEGPIVRQMMMSFNKDWEFTTHEALNDAHWWPEIDVTPGGAMRVIESGPDQRYPKVEEHWASAMEQAEHRIRIVTPYFLPEEKLIEVIMRAAWRGVEVEIIVPQHSNHFYVDWATRAHVEALPLDRVKVIEGAPPFDHSKLMTVDGLWCSFGSPNWDARSLRLNFEMLVECYDTGVTADVDALIDARLAGGRRLTRDMLNARSWPIKLRDAACRLALPYL